MLNLLPDRVEMKIGVMLQATEELARQELGATRQRMEEVAEGERRWKEGGK